MKSPVWRAANWASLVTSIGSMASLCALFFLLRHDPRLALSGLAVALATDRMDGLVARRLHQESRFGAHLDSLNDAVAFGVVPPVIAVYLTGQSVIVAVSGLIFALGALWRLADFNEGGLVQQHGRSYFRGMPTTDVAAWFFLVGSLMADKVLSMSLAVWIVSLFLVVGGIAMTSGVLYQKNGVATKVLLVLVPLTVIGLWLH